MHAVSLLWAKLLHILADQHSCVWLHVKEKELLECIFLRPIKLKQQEAIQFREYFAIEKFTRKK